MNPVPQEDWPELRVWFAPERPGPLVGPHVLATGRDGLWADRWPAPRALLACVGDNVSLRGDPAALRPDDLPADWQVFVDAPEPFLPLLRERFPDLSVWPRVILELPRAPSAPVAGAGRVRRLVESDLPALEELSPELAWVCQTLGGAAGLARSRLGFGAFVEGRLASLAAPFLIGERYEDLGVVTEAPFRGRGLNPACAARLAEDVRSRGRRPSWSTSPDNRASLSVARKLGFRRSRDDVLYVVGMPLPEPARLP